jgi:antibiotic biosynthesis monooxygenase (ABM) superfamily enzyme
MNTQWPTLVVHDYVLHTEIKIKQMLHRFPRFDGSMVVTVQIVVFWVVTVYSYSWIPTSQRKMSLHLKGQKAQDKKLVQIQEMCLDP